MGGSYVEKKKNCFFKARFKIIQAQATSDGMLVSGILKIFGADETVFVIKHKNDYDQVDGDFISGLFEYMGNYSYESAFGTTTVLKFKHVE